MIDMSMLASWSVSLIFSQFLLQDADIVIEPEGAPEEQVAVADGMDFGDDTSMFANDGECDDPRFEGTGMASQPFQADLKRDATDCRAAFERGDITLIVDNGSDDAQTYDYDFGDDSSMFARDRECDDPRFEGPGVSDLADISDVLSDASDCRAAVERGEATFVGLPETASDDPFFDSGAFETVADAAGEGIDYGDDSSLFANDGECDDPRFDGPGVSAAPLASDSGRDASDCRAAVDRGQAQFVGAGGGVDPADIDYGDNTSMFANDGECDDPRFAGEGVAAAPSVNHQRRDADDCRQAVEAGRATLVDAGAVNRSGTSGERMSPDAIAAIDFGDDTSSYANDGECDDPRFEGDGVAFSPSRAHWMADASDCRAMVLAGRAVYTGELEALFEGTADGVDYGDNSGPYADDGECDDPRFEGDGVAISAQRINARRDAHDCRNAVTSGVAIYDGELTPLFEGEADGIDFGGNDSTTADDDQCDDPRFRGPGMALTPFVRENMRQDAHDCRWHQQRGFVTLVIDGEPFTGEFNGVNFGDNSHEYALDGECDDGRFEGPKAFDTEDQLTDATDCKIAYERGEIILKADSPTSRASTGGDD